MPFIRILDGHSFPITAPSAIAPRSLVKLAGTSGLQILQVASVNDRPFGALGDATAVAGDTGAVFEGVGNVVKLVAAASLGAGAEVMVGSIGVASAAQRNAIATITLLQPLGVASGTRKWSVGFALDAAAAGETFSCYIMPRLTGVFDA